MGNEVNYRKAPIAEAIIGLRVAFDAPVAMEQFEGAFTDEAQRYPSARRLQQGVGQFEFGPQMSASASAKDLGMAFKTGDGKQIVQFRQDGFAFSRLAPYESWQPFASEARRLWNVFRNGLSPKSINRLDVRYINRIELPPTKDDISVWLKTYPQVDDGVSSTLDGFFMHVTAGQPKLNAELALIETVDSRKSGPDNGPAIILDIDLFRIFEVPQEEEAIWGFFEQLHERKNEVFEACITDRTRELFR